MKTQNWHKVEVLKSSIDMVGFESTSTLRISFVLFLALWIPLGFTRTAVCLQCRLLTAGTARRWESVASQTKEIKKNAEKSTGVEEPTGQRLTW